MEPKLLTLEQVHEALDAGQREELQEWVALWDRENPDGAEEPEGGEDE